MVGRCILAVMLPIHAIVWDVPSVFLSNLLRLGRKTKLVLRDNKRSENFAKLRFLFLISNEPFQTNLCCTYSFPCKQAINNLSSFYYFQEALEEILIPRVEINGGRKPRIVEYCIKKVLKPVVDFRESLFDRCFAIDGYLANRMLTMGYKFPSRFGRWCPVKVTQEPSQSALNQIRALLSP